MTKVRMTCERSTSGRGPQTPRARVLAAMRETSGSNLKAAVAWYRNEQLAPFDCKTAKILVAEGRADDVIALLESYEAGFVG